MDVMSSRERILNTFARRETDRLAWAPLIDGYFIGSLGDNLRNLSVVEVLRIIGADIIERHVPAGEFIYHGNISHYKKRAGSDYIETFETPVGSINSITRPMWSATCNAQVKFFVESIEDLKVLQYVEEHKEFKPDFRYFKKEQKIIGDDGIATVSATSTPLANLFEFYMGLENFIYTNFDYPNQIRTLMEIMHMNNIKEHKLLAESSSEAIFIYEDTSTTCISRNYYMEFCKNQLDDYAKIAHDAGKYYFVHMCGKVKGLSDLIKHNKMDGIDSLCPPTTGDFHAYEALEMWEDKVIIGGLEPSMLQRSAVEEVKEYVTSLLAKVKPFGRLVLSTGDATAYGTPIENFMAITDIVKNMERS